MGCGERHGVALNRPLAFLIPSARPKPGGDNLAIPQDYFCAVFRSGRDWLPLSHADSYQNPWRHAMHKALIALTAALAVGACADTKRIAEHLPTPPERLICEPAGTRPVVEAEYQIDWNRVAAARTVPEAVLFAQDEHRNFVGVLRSREGIVAGYILQLEKKHFICWTNMQWRRDYEAGIQN